MQELISPNLLPDKPSTNPEEAQQRDGWYLGKPPCNHEDGENAGQVKTIDHVYDATARQAREKTQTMMWFEKKTRAFVTNSSDLFSVP